MTSHGLRLAASGPDGVMRVVRGIVRWVDLSRSSDRFAVAASPAAQSVTTSAAAPAAPSSQGERWHVADLHPGVFERISWRSSRVED